MYKKNRTSLPCTLLLFLVISVQFEAFGQYFFQVTHLTGAQEVNGTDVTVIPEGHTSSLYSYCPMSTYPYVIGSNGTFPNQNGQYTFKFTPSTDSVKLNFSGLNFNLGGQEIIQIFVNGIHYPLSEVGTPNCDDLAAINAEGNVYSTSNSESGWDGTVIPGPISELTVKDSIVNGGPNGSLFSIFICDVINQLTERQKPLVIFPNPVNDRLYIDADFQGTVKMSILDAVGRVMVTKEYTGSPLIIDCSNMSIGSYVCRLWTEGGKPRSVRFVKE